MEQQRKELASKVDEMVGAQRAAAEEELVRQKDKLSAKFHQLSSGNRCILVLCQRVLLLTSYFQSRCVKPLEKALCLATA